MLTLRPYQQAAVDAVYRYLSEHDDNPVVVIPTAGGKSLVMSQVVRDAVLRWKGRVLILAHVKELLEQTADKIQKVCPEVAFGIYSAGLKSRQTLAPVIVAGIQSVYKRACELGAFDLILVDEVHLIPESGEGMYRTFLADMKVINPKVHIVGFTATPFRMKSGPLCGPENILNAICYEVSVKELIRDGYLSPLISKAGTEKADFTGLHIRGGEFVSGEVEALMDDKHLVESACREIIAYTQDRKACLIFASGVRHAEHVAETLKRMGKDCGTVFGDTLPLVREQVLEDFKAGRLKYLANVGVLTTGFDAPIIDCVVLLRPTNSPGLYLQAIGRGFRLHPGKADCLVLDFGGNVLRHGPVDAIKLSYGEHPGREGSGEAPAKECPHCRALIAAGLVTCPQCGHVFPRNETKHEASASTAGILTGQVSVATYPVQDIAYHLHVKRGAPPDAPRTLRVDYQVALNRWISEWVCFEHDGYARQKAEHWWRLRSNDPVPETIDAAIDAIESGAASAPKAITVRSVAGEDFPRITGYELEPKPAALEAIEYHPIPDSEVPF